MSADKRITDKLYNLIYDIERLDIWLDNPASDMTLGKSSSRAQRASTRTSTSIDEMLGAGTCELVNAADDLGEGTSSCMCSKCGYTAPDDWWDRFKHCPNCGARIEEEAG